MRSVRIKIFNTCRRLTTRRIPAVSLDNILGDCHVRGLRLIYCSDKTLNLLCRLYKDLRHVEIEDCKSCTRNGQTIKKRGINRECSLEKPVTRAELMSRPSSK